MLRAKAVELSRRKFHGQESKVEKCLERIIQLVEIVEKHALKGGTGKRKRK